MKKTCDSCMEPYEKGCLLALLTFLIAFLMVFVLVILSVHSASAITQSFSVNDSQLPFFYEFNVSIGVNPNDVIIVNHSGKSNIASLIFDQQFSANASLYNYSINYTIPFFANISPNPFIIADTITIRNNNTGNQTEFTFTASVLFNLTNLTINQTVNTSVSIVGPQYFVIRTFDVLLPFLIQQNVTVFAKPDIQIDITCAGSFVVCPGPFFVPASTNSSIITVNVSVPNGTVVNNYTSFAIFSQGNATQTATFETQILKGTPQIIAITDIINQDECAKDFKECARKYSIYFAQLYNDVIEAEKNKGQCTNQTIEKEKIVVAGEVNEVLLSEQSRLSKENRDLSDQIIKLNDDYLSCRIEMNNAQSSLSSNTAEFSKQIRDVEQQLKLSIESEKERKKKNLYTYGTIGILGLLAFLFFRSYGKNNWWWS